MKRRKIVLLRSEDENTEMADFIVSKDFEPLTEPILIINDLEADYSPIKKGSPLIFTSAHGVRVLANHVKERDNPVYAVGRNTEAAARQEGFFQVETGEGGVENLADMLVSSLKDTKETPVYIRAADISHDLRRILHQKGVSIAEITAYSAEPAQNLSLSLLQSLDRREVGAILFYSKRGGEVFSGLIEQYARSVRLKSIKALCISEAVLQSVSVLPFRQCLVAPTADRHGMMKLVEEISVNEE
jgi:uroporphyrinogen-III synthase